MTLYYQLYFKNFRKEPSNFPLLLSKNLTTTTKCLENLTEMSFEELRVPTLGIFHQTQLSLKGLGRSTGLVLDSGYGTT